MESAESRKPCLSIGFVLLAATLWAGSGAAWAQDRYDDHEMADKFYITLGGFQQTELRTTLRLDAKTETGAIAAGAVVALESLFDLDDQVSTGRLDGWYRFNKKHRIGWTFWSSSREGTSTYNGDDTIEIGEIVIEPGDNIAMDDDSKLFAANWSYSFINTRKYEFWLGAGLNFQSVKMVIDVNVGGDDPLRLEEEAKGTIPIPTFNFGGRYNFGERWRMIFWQQLFGIKIGDYSGKLGNTRVLAEYNVTKRFGIGGGFERFNFEVDAEGEDFRGEFDTSYTAFTLYLKGQL